MCVLVASLQVMNLCLYMRTCSTNTMRSPAWRFRICILFVRKILFHFIFFLKKLFSLVLWMFGLRQTCCRSQMYWCCADACVRVWVYIDVVVVAAAAAVVVVVVFFFFDFLLWHFHFYILSLFRSFAFAFICFARHCVAAAVAAMLCMNRCRQRFNHFNTHTLHTNWTRSFLVRRSFHYPTIFLRSLLAIIVGTAMVMVLMTECSMGTSNAH